VSASRWHDLPLLAGALLGIALAAAGLAARPAQARLPDDAVAVVNGYPIRRADYDSALAALASERRGELDPALRRHVLDRLIEEELLVQAALDLGLARHDRRVRSDLSSAAIGFLVDAPEGREPSEAELRAFFDEHTGAFTTDALLEVEEVPSGPPPLPLPRGPLPLRKLEQYIGPSAARRCASLPEGGVTEVVPGSDGPRRFRLIARTGGATPSFEDVRAEVKAARERWTGEQRLLRFLRERRARAAVTLAEDLGT
jgi:hypothetical protein